jgi:hypothetical protein
MDLEKFKELVVLDKVEKVKLVPYRWQWFIEVQTVLKGDFESLTDIPTAFYRANEVLAYLEKCGYRGDIIFDDYPDFFACFSVDDIYSQLFITKQEDIEFHPVGDIRRVLSRLNLYILGYGTDKFTRETILHLYTTHPYYTRSVRWLLVRALKEKSERLYDISCAGVPF